MKNTNANENYYFIGIGEKSYFYTLNYTWLDIVWHAVGDAYGTKTPEVVRRYSFIRNLSHDYDEAVEKAKEWHKNNADRECRLKYGTKETMSDRKSPVARLHKIEDGYMLSGKHVGIHVSIVPKEYVYWMVREMYRPDVGDSDQNLNALICFKYADEQGWIGEWEKEGVAKFNDVFDADVLNAKIKGSEFLVGKYKGLSIDDPSLKTKKGELLSSVSKTLKWYADQETMLDNIIQRNGIVSEELEDGNELYTIDTSIFLDVAANGMGSIDFMLTVLMIRDKFRIKEMEKRGISKYPQYKFDKSNFIIPTHVAVKLSTNR